MTLKIEAYIRKPFEIQAVRVTKDNLEEVASWCKGEVLTNEDSATKERLIKVEVRNPLNEKQTRAFVGDWVLHSGSGGYKVYTDQAFRRSFDRVRTLQPTEVAEASKKLAAAHNSRG